MRQIASLAAIAIWVLASAVEPASAEAVKIALPVASLESMPIYLAEEKGLFKKHDVEVDIVTSRGGGGEILGALKSGRADAAMLFEPFVAIAVREGIATMVVDVAEALDAFSSSPLSTSKAFLEKSPKQAQAVFDALAEALTIIHADKATTLEMAKKKFANADVTILEAALARMEKAYLKDGRFTRANVDRTQAISVDLKIMPQIYSYEQVVAPPARE